MRRTAAKSAIMSIIRNEKSARPCVSTAGKVVSFGTFTKAFREPKEALMESFRTHYGPVDLVGL